MAESCNMLLPISSHPTSMDRGSGSGWGSAWVRLGLSRRAHSKTTRMASLARCSFRHGLYRLNPLSRCLIRRALATYPILVRFERYLDHPMLAGPHRPLALGTFQNAGPAALVAHDSIIPFEMTVSRQICSNLAYICTASGRTGPRAGLYGGPPEVLSTQVGTVQEDVKLQIPTTRRKNDFEARRPRGIPVP